MHSGTRVLGFSEERRYADSWVLAGGVCDIRCAAVRVNAGSLELSVAPLCMDCDCGNIACGRSALVV